MSRDGSIPEVNNGAAYLAYKSGTPIVPVYMANLALGPKTSSTPRREDTVEGLGSVLHNIFNRDIEVYVARPIFPRTQGVDRKKEINRLNAEIRRSFDELRREASRN